jgi:hypothetical protein
MSFLVKLIPMPARKKVEKRMDTKISYKDMIECVFMVAAKASDTLPKSFAGRYMRNTLYITLEKLWSGDEADREVILDAFEKWAGENYEPSDIDDSDSTELEQESVGSE